MKSNIFRKFNTSNPIQVLNNARNLIKNQKQLKKIQQSLVYLNNSFNYNIQMQETYIDISKSKKKNINSDQIKKLYQLFSENKANQCIFLQTYNTETKVQRHRSIIDDDFINYNTFNSSFMNVIQEEDEEPAESDKNITKNGQYKSKIKKSSIEHSQNSTLQNTENQKGNYQQDTFSKKQIKIIKNNNQELSFLLKRIYCRLIQKILVKIAFYTMNSKHLQCIAESVNILTRNLQTSIRKFKYFKDTRFLHQTILKIYRENFIIQAQIYKSLVNEGYIISVDQFYRVNGLDADSKQFYQKNSELLQTLQKQDDFKKQEDQKIKMMQLKNKQRKDKQIQKAQKLKNRHLQKLNNQTQEKYKYCLYEIKKLLKQQTQHQQQNLRQSQSQEEEVTTQNSNKRNSLNYSTQKSNFKKSIIVNRSSHQKIKPFRKSRFSNINESTQKLNQIITQKETDKFFYETVSTQEAFSQVSSRKRKQGKFKSMLPMEKRLSAFSSQFSKILKSIPNSKLQVSTKYLSERFIQFVQNSNDKNRLKENQRAIRLRNSSIKSKKYGSKNGSSLFQSIEINKLLKLYQKKNSLNDKIIKEATKQVLQQMKIEKQSSYFISNVTEFSCNQLPTLSKNQNQKHSIIYQTQSNQYDKINKTQLKLNQHIRTQYTNDNTINLLDQKYVTNFQRQYRHSLQNKKQMDYYHKKKFSLRKRSPRFASNFIIFNNFRNLSMQNSNKINIQSNSTIKNQKSEDQKASLLYNIIKCHKDILQEAYTFENLNKVLDNLRKEKSSRKILQKQVFKSQKLIYNNKFQGQTKLKNNNSKKSNLSNFWYLKQQKTSSLTTWEKQNIIQSTKFSIFGKNIESQKDFKEIVVNQNNETKIQHKIMKKAYHSTNLSPIKKVIKNQIQEEKEQQVGDKVYQIYDVRRKKIFIQ